MGPGGEDIDAAVYRPPSRACDHQLFRCRAVSGATCGPRGEAWPIRPVKYVNGFPAGGATDTLSRVLCQKMSELSGQSFVVENKAGAGGVLGADAIAKSPADGYTVGLGGIASNVLAIGSLRQAAVSSARGFHLHLRHVAIAEHPDREEGPVLRRSQGTARGVQEGAGQIHLRLRRLRHHAASLRRDDEQHGGRAGQARALPGRRAGAERPARRQCRSAVRQSAGLAAERALGRDQAGRGHREDAAGGASRRARDGRTVARLRDHLMDRPDRPREHAAPTSSRRSTRSP